MGGAHGLQNSSTFAVGKGRGTKEASGGQWAREPGGRTRGRNCECYRERSSSALSALPSAAFAGASAACVASDRGSSVPTARAAGGKLISLRQPG